MSRGLLFMMLVGLTPIASFAVKPTAASEAGPNDFLTRLEAVALVQTLNAEILASRSATLTLERWCNEHGLAGIRDAKIVARSTGIEPKPLTEEQRHRLAIGPEVEVKYRHVQLFCGDQVLSEADNWYVPSRLTGEMNRVLETTATPFGKTVMDLKPYRQTYAVNVLWWPLPKGWETKPVPAAPETATLEIPEVIFEHRAVLYANGLPFSEVHELYRRQLLSFPWPHP
jgi:chorismate-pyruvate lyase